MTLVAEPVLLYKRQVAKRGTKKRKAPMASASPTPTSGSLLESLKRLQAEVASLKKAVSETNQDTLTDTELEALFTGVMDLAVELEDLGGTLEWDPA